MSTWLPRGLGKVGKNHFSLFDIKNYKYCKAIIRRMTCDKRPHSQCWISTFTTARLIIFMKPFSLYLSFLHSPSALSPAQTFYVDEESSLNLNRRQRYLTEAIYRRPFLFIAGRSKVAKDGDYRRVDEMLRGPPSTAGRSADDLYEIVSRAKVILFQQVTSGKQKFED